MLSPSGYSGKIRSDEVPAASIVKSSKHGLPVERLSPNSEAKPFMKIESKSDVELLGAERKGLNTANAGSMNEFPQPPIEMENQNSVPDDL